MNQEKETKKESGKESFTKEFSPAIVHREISGGLGKLLIVP